MDSFYDVIWHSGWIFSSQSHPRPNWSGFMQQSFYKNEVEFQQSDVLLLPIIDLPPTDLTCIYSTLFFIQDQAKKMNIFHTIMSFLGAVGYMMSGSDFEELLELFYAMNSVGHMMSSTAFARAIRGHFLDDSCLNNILIDKIVKEENNPEGLENIDCLKWLYSNSTERPVDFSDIKNRRANATTWPNQKLEQEKHRLTETSTTGQLCAGDKDVYLCLTNRRLGESFRCYKKNAQFVCRNRPI